MGAYAEVQFSNRAALYYSTGDCSDSLGIYCLENRQPEEGIANGVTASECSTPRGWRADARRGCLSPRPEVCEPFEQISPAL